MIRDREHYATHLVDWVQDWVWTYDPRDLEEPFKPFILFPRQIEMLEALERHVEIRRDLFIEKARDCGMSWLAICFAAHRWLYRPGYNSTFGSYVEDKVDRLGDPDSLLEKFRILLRWLPKWMRPPGYVEARHATHMRIVNPANGAVVTGEVGDNMGRGGRSSVYFVDEAAFVAHADRVNAATSANSDVRIWISSPNQTGTFFSEKTADPDVSVFRFHWRDDPRKSEEWAKAERKRIGAQVFKREYALDTTGGIGNLLVPGDWVQAAVTLRRRYPDPPGGIRVAGMDVGAGKDLSVLIVSAGHFVLTVLDNDRPDTTDTARWAKQETEQFGAAVLNFDSIGVGAGVKSTLEHERSLLFQAVPVNTGLPADPGRVWPQGATSQELFANTKAEIWWLMREAFKRAHELVLWEDGEEGGIEHPLLDCARIPDNRMLVTQLSSVRWLTSGTRIIVESKESLARRGIKSPDFADALALTYFSGGFENWLPDAVQEIPRGKGSVPDW